MNLKNLSAITKIPNSLKQKLKNKKINQIYNKFEKSISLNEKFLVAVSGGPDSLALAFLAKIYSIKKGLTSKFVIIDHKLRSESTKEAKHVKKILKKYYIDCEILTWKGKKPLKNIQSLARKKRYELLSKKSDKYEINNILLGHHQDDMLENFFIRLLRGSGLNGLVSFDFKTKIRDKNLLRPLLDQKKEDLIYIAKYVFNFFVTDPSNYDEKYQRIRIRKLIEELHKNGLNKKLFNKTIQNLKFSNETANFYVLENLKNNTFFSPKKNQSIISKFFFDQPYEIVFRAFSESIRLVGKKYYYVRGKKVDKIIKNIKKGGSFRATLGGCIIEKVNQSVIISKES